MSTLRTRLPEARIAQYIRADRWTKGAHPCAPTSARDRYFDDVQGGLTGYSGYSQGYSPGTQGVLKGYSGYSQGYSGYSRGCAVRYFYDVQSPWLETDVKGASASGQAAPWLSGNAKWERASS